MSSHLKYAALVLGALLAVGVSRAQAQVDDPIEADIPFSFHAGDSAFPAGHYVVRAVDPRLEDVLEIRSKSGEHSGVFMVERAQAEAPLERTELVFDKYGDQYFLSKVFEKGHTDGSEVPQSHYEKMMVMDGKTPVTHRVAGHHRKEG